MDPTELVTRITEHYGAVYDPARRDEVRGRFASSTKCQRD
jgi:hypothetical protein